MASLSTIRYDKERPLVPQHPSHSTHSTHHFTQDPLNNGQNLSRILGKIIRIDPLGNNSTNGQYGTCSTLALSFLFSFPHHLLTSFIGIPFDNPWANDGDPSTLGEIWAYGLRNPHRFGWDPTSKFLFIAEMGQYYIDEINIGRRGIVHSM